MPGARKVAAYRPGLAADRCSGLHMGPQTPGEEGVGKTGDVLRMCSLMRPAIWREDSRHTMRRAVNSRCFVCKNLSVDLFSGVKEKAGHAKSLGNGGLLKHFGCRVLVGALGRIVRGTTRQVESAPTGGERFR
ncbi:hypothetical protein Bbelb_091310 [Branchiostoma belcheri]|nr:hypothetical protein Bbelb_091310 [Branchiostoma belcheri]